MRTLIVTEFISLDGVVDSPGGGDHPHAGWTFKDVEFDEAAYEIKGREQADAGAHPTRPSELRRVRAGVADHGGVRGVQRDAQVRRVEHPDRTRSGTTPTVLRSLDEVAELKQGEGGTILVHASPTLGAGPRRRRSGRPLPPPVSSPCCSAAASGSSAEGDKTKLQLVEHAAYGNGIQLAVYDVVHS